MRVKRLSIKKQEDHTFAIVATIESSNGSTKEIILEGGASKANDLQQAFLVLMNDEESLQVEIQYQLSQVS